MSRVLRVVAMAAALLCVGTLPAHASAAPAPHHALGLQPSAQYHAPLQASAFVNAQTLPASVDLTPWAPPAGDQGPVGSCVSWAVDYTAMGWFLNKQGDPGPPLAPMFTYAQIAQGVDNGSSYYETFAIAETQGVDSHADYTQGDFDYTTQPTVDEITNAHHWVLSGDQDIAVSATAIKGALAANEPVGLAIPVYNNFFYLNAGNSDYSSVSGGLAGYHALTALGYDSYGVTVENSWGASWGNNGFARLSWSFIANYALEAHAFLGVSYTPDAPLPGAPTISDVSPSGGAVAGGQDVTITGSNFAPDATVAFGAAAATNIAVSVDGTQITATTPAHSSGTIDVTVDGLTGTSAPNAFTNYTFYGPPTVSSVSPRGGSANGGAVVTINGTNLWGATVNFGATPQSASVTDDGLQLTVIAPPGAPGKVPISIDALYGSTNAGGFIYFAKPTISSVTAAKTPPSIGTAVTIVGTNLYGATVTIGGHHATVVSATSDGTHLVVKFPAGVPRPAAWVVVRNPVGGASFHKSFG